MHYDFMRLVHHVACFLTAICALHVGLHALGYDVFSRIPFLASNELYISYVFGVAGLISLICMVIHSTCGCHCNKPS
ncbi:MAG: hypothetical protein WCE21_02565 [Candidatus Babeliales bacterium]